MIAFVQETEGLDFVGAVEWLADRYRVELEYEESSPEHEAGPQAPRAAARAARRRRALSTSGTSGRPRRRARTRLPRRRGLGEDVCREFRLGLSPGGDAAAQGAREGLHGDELAAAGLVNRRGNDYFAGRLVFPLADARGRVLGFGAPATLATTIRSGEVRQLAGERAVPKGVARLRPRPCAAGDREGGPRDRRRGLHRRPRAPPGGPRRRRRLDGDGADRATAP